MDVLSSNGFLGSYRLIFFNISLWNQKSWSILHFSTYQDVISRGTDFFPFPGFRYDVKMLNWMKMSCFQSKNCARSSIG